MKKLLISVVVALLITAAIIFTWYYLVWKPGSDRVAAFTALFSGLAFFGVMAGLVVQILNQQSSLKMALKTGRLQFLIAAFEFTGPRLEEASKDLLPLLEMSKKRQLSVDEEKELHKKEGVFKHLRAEYKRIHAEIHYMTESVIHEKIRETASKDEAAINEHADTYINQYMKK